MTPLKNQLGKKGLIKYFKIINAIIPSIFKWMFCYSGLEFIYRKLNPAKNPQTLPTGFIWLIGMYIALFALASQRYENRIDIIGNRANAIFAQLAVPFLEKKATPQKERLRPHPTI